MRTVILLFTVNYPHSAFIKNSCTVQSDAITFELTLTKQLDLNSSIFVEYRQLHFLTIRISPLKVNKV